MKKIFLLSVLSWAFMACTNQEEPVRVDMPKVKVNTEFLKEYKSDLSRRPVVIGMHYDWGMKAGYNLMNTPDSLDIVVLKNSYNAPTELMLEDLHKVQRLKATKVVPSLDLEEQSVQFAKELKKEYKAKRKELLKTWAAEGKKPATDEEVQNAFKKLKDDVASELIVKMTDDLKNSLAQLPSYLNDVGYDGISVRLPESNEPFSNETMTEVLTKITTLCGKDHDKIFIVESPNVAYSPFIEKANYVVGYHPESVKYMDFVDEANAYPEKKYIPSFDLKDEKLAKGFEDLPYFTPSNEDKSLSLLKMDVPNYGGIAVYHSELYYFKTAEYNKFIRTNISFKNLINRLFIIKGK